MTVIRRSGRRLRALATSRYLAPAAVTSAFLAMLLLYCFANPLYRPVMTFWGVAVAEPPFVDGHSITSALQCTRQGYDVLIENPCDALGRVHVYSPFWLLLAALPVDNDWNLPLSITLDLTFAASLGLLPRARSCAAAGVMLAGLLSYTTAYAMERANNDLIIFIMAVGVVICASSAKPAVRPFGYLLAFLAGALKYYPMILFLLALREPIRRCLAIAALVTASAATLIYLGRHQLAEEATSLSIRIASWNTDSFGIVDLGRGLLDAIPPLNASLHRLGVGASVFVALVGLAMLAQSAFHAVRLLRAREFAASLARLSTRRRLCLLAGTSMILGCFLSGANINYRGIFLLFTLPGLTVLADTEGAVLPRIFKHGIFLILFVMWSEFFRRSIDFATDEAGLPLPLSNFARLLYWIVLQLAWWRIAALFAAIVIAFVLDSEAFRPLRAWRSGAMRNA